MLPNHGSAENTRRVLGFYALQLALAVLIGCGFVGLNFHIKHG